MEIVTGGWLIGPKLVRPEAYPACASSKLYKFIFWKLGDSGKSGETVVDFGLCEKVAMDQL